MVQVQKPQKNLKYDNVFISNKYCTDPTDRRGTRHKFNHFHSRKKMARINSRNNFQNVIPMIEADMKINAGINTKHATTNLVYKNTA